MNKSIEDVLRLAAFADGDSGGNPAGVWIGEALPPEEQMQRVATAVGFSETAFAAPRAEGYRVRYFSPEAEVPFCGHATIALGAVLARREGDGVFPLELNEATISVEGRTDGGRLSATLQSPPTRSESADPAMTEAVLTLFGYRADQLEPSLPPARVHAGADHFLVALSSREALRAMRYDLDAGRRLMNEAGLVTILFVFVEGEQRFHTRNAFASGGVLEDPATGAATAALGGYLRDLGWSHGGAIDVVQGEDMGARSRLYAEIPSERGASVRVSGTVRYL